MRVDVVKAQPCGDEQYENDGQIIADHASSGGLSIDVRVARTRKVESWKRIGRNVHTPFTLRLKSADGAMEINAAIFPVLMLANREQWRENPKETKQPRMAGSDTTMVRQNIRIDRLSSEPPD